MLTVAAFTGGKTIPSARFRVRQYIPGLRRFGVAVRESPARFGSYPPLRRALKPGWAAVCLAERLAAILSAPQTEITLLQREMLSTLATVERFTKPPRVLDVDDAIWLNGESDFALAIARQCRLTICGNTYIADYFASHGCHVAVLPTPVDTDRLTPAGACGQDVNRTICWIGTSSGYRYLRDIEEALAIVLGDDRRRRLRVISDIPPHLPLLDQRQVEFVPWSETSEVSSLRSASVGIMPLDGSAWAHGKCAYKLLTYMACGLPAVASPVGMNAHLLRHSSGGLIANTRDEWVDALSYLLDNPGQASLMGLSGRQTVAEHYSLETCLPRLARILHSVAENGPPPEILQ